MTNELFDVVVVGAGPAGSSTALRLARAGRHVLLLDRAAFPRDKACSEYTSPETVRHLDDLGVLPALDASGNASLRGTRVTAADGSALTGVFARAGGTPFRSTGLSISRRVLDHSLLTAAATAGVNVLEEAHATHLGPATPDGRTVQVRTPDGQVRTIGARVIVGADGLRSMVARRAGLRRTGRLRRIAFVSHVRGVRDIGDTAELHVGRAGYVGLNPLADGVTNVALVVPASEVNVVAQDVATFLHDQLERFPGVRGRVDVGRTVRSIMTTGPFDAMSRRSVDDALLVVGDAADFFDPFTGEGICSALAGGEMAAQVIDRALSRRGPIGAADLSHYRSLRRKAFLGKWIVERMIGYSMLAPRMFDRAVDRLERRGMADMLIGVTGNFVSPWRVVNPLAIARMIV